MSSLAEAIASLGGRLVAGQVSDREFFAVFQTSAEDAVAFGLRVLRRALAERDNVLVHFGAYVGHRFGFTSEHILLLTELAEAPWHTNHENVVSGLVELRDPRSVDVLYRTALARFPYLDYDDSYSLGVKCIWGLSGISTEAALARLDQLSCCRNDVLERAAVKQLTRLFTRPPSEAIHALASRMLARIERVVAILESALADFDVTLLALGLSIGRQLGFDAACIEPLAELARCDFHHSHDEVLGALASIDSPAAVQALRQLADDEPRLRGGAARALASMANDTSLSSEVRGDASRAP